MAILHATAHPFTDSSPATLLEIAKALESCAGIDLYGVPWSGFDGLTAPLDMSAHWGDNLLQTAGLGSNRVFRFLIRSNLVKDSYRSVSVAWDRKAKGAGMLTLLRAQISAHNRLIHRYKTGPVTACKSTPWE